MAYDLYNDDDNANLIVLGIGESGCKAIEYLREQRYFDEYREVRYSTVFSHADLLPKANTDQLTQIDTHIPALFDSKANAESINGYLHQCIGDVFKAVDALFILTDFRDSENIKRVSAVSRMLAKKEITNARFIVAIISQPALYEGKLLQQQFNQGKQELLKYCDTVIVNSTDMIHRKLKENDGQLTDYVTQAFEANYQSLQVFIRTIAMQGLICVDFADVYAVVADMNEAIVVSAKGEGDDRANQAVNVALKNIEQEWGVLFNPEIGAVLVDICAADMALEELDVIASIIYQAFLGTVRIKIGTAMDEKMNDQLEVTILVVKRKLEIHEVLPAIEKDKTVSL